MSNIMHHDERGERERERERERGSTTPRFCRHFSNIRISTERERDRGGRREGKKERERGVN